MAAWSADVRISARRPPRAAQARAASVWFLRAPSSWKHLIPRSPTQGYAVSGTNFTENSRVSETPAVALALMVPGMGPNGIAPSTPMPMPIPDSLAYLPLSTLGLTGAAANFSDSLAVPMMRSQGGVMVILIVGFCQPKVAVQLFDSS